MDSTPQEPTPFQPLADDYRSASADEAHPPLLRPNGTFWLFYLFLRPKRFFHHFVIESSPGLTALAAWMMGISEAINEIEERALKADLAGRSFPFQDFLSHWSTYWVLCLAAGVFGGVFYFSIGGWWYRLRIQFCGMTNADKHLARRVYVFASQVYAIPCVLYTLWETRRYESPLAASQGEDIGGLFIVLFLFWSIYTSYRGVRTAFDVRRWAARMWFMILPAAIYSLVLVGVAAAFAAQAGFFQKAPAVDKPIAIDRPGFTLRYPVNWEVDTEQEFYDPDYDFFIEPLWYDAGVQFNLYDEPIAPSEEVDFYLAKLMENGWKNLSKQSIDRWGQFQGSGYHFQATVEGTLFEGLVFAATTEHAGFEILEFCEMDHYATQAPGFQLIRDSFRLRENRQPNTSAPHQP